MKRLAVVGRGTVGCLTVAHFLRYTDWDIVWVYDPSIEPAPVGEGTTLIFPTNLANTLNFNSVDMDAMNSTPKLGIWKRNWGAGQEYVHTFFLGDYGLHFNAVQFQDYVFQRLKNNPRVQTLENFVGDVDSIDADHVMVCTGSPKDLSSFDLHHSIPVNSALVMQCPWDHAKFPYSLTFAKKFGWVFGIPLKNRCAIGYVYNKDFCLETDVEADVQDVLQEFDLRPATRRKLRFDNYSRKVNFSDRVCYNGNASFFLEPLEATSTTQAIFVNQLALALWHDQQLDLDEANRRYKQAIREIETMISLHYFSGSVYDNDFWKHARQLAQQNIQTCLQEKNSSYHALKAAVESKNFYDTFRFDAKLYSSPYNNDVGTWPLSSYVQNIDNLGVRETLRSMLTA